MKRPAHNLCGPVPKHRNWRKIKVSNLTRAERVMRFISAYCVTPEGRDVGKPLKLARFQEDFLYAVYDNPHITRMAVMSLGRKNGKTALLAAIILAHLCGPEANTNAQLVSGALSRDQAALVHSLASKMAALSPALMTRIRAIPSTKRLLATNGSEFKALAADGARAQGLSPAFVLIDEGGQIVGPSSKFVEALTTSQGAHENPLLIIISTQAASDADYLSLMIDDAQRSGDPHTVCHVYAADPQCDLMDKTQWKKANPALGLFRSEKDLEEQLKKASRMPSVESSARNLLLNQRISLQSLWISPSIWKENALPVDLDVFHRMPVSIGLDLSKRDDLTAAVLSAKDENSLVHLKPLVFIPAEGLEEKALRDRAPYPQWVKSGHLIAVPGKVVDYDWVADYLAKATADMFVAELNFDRWGIESFQAAASRSRLEVATWVPVGQGYKDMGPRVAAFEQALLQGKIAHGSHPLLNMAISNAISVSDPAGNRKLDKSKATQRIDPAVAMVMSAYSLIQRPENALDLRTILA